MDHHQSNLSHSVKLSTGRRGEISLASIIPELKVRKRKFRDRVFKKVSSLRGIWPLVFLVCSFLQSQQAEAWESLHWGGDMSLGLPQPLVVGAQVYCQGSEWFCRKELRGYANTGVFLMPFGSGGKNSAFLFSAEFGGRYFPLQVPFNLPIYFSLGVGFRQLSLTADISSFKIAGETIATSGSLNLSSFYFYPTVGGEFQLTSSLVLSIDAGLQLPLLAAGNFYLVDATSGTNSNNSSNLATNSETAMGRIASLMIPCVTLARLTWLFSP